MNQLKRSEYLGCEDLMRELSVIEKEIMKENSALAMDLMVLEAKIRDRFNCVQSHSSMTKPVFSDDISFEEIQAMIPRELGPFPTIDEVEALEKKKRVAQNVMWAGIFAVVTALGVFGLASLVQLGLNWLA